MTRKKKKGDNLSKSIEKRLQAFCGGGPYHCTPEGLEAHSAELEALWASGLSRPAPRELYTVDDNGIARMHISGFIIDEPDSYTEAFGMHTTIERMEALESLDAKALLLTLATPGGEGGNIIEFGRMIDGMDIPVYTYASQQATSAGMVIIVAGHEAFASKMAILGSIGVKMPKPSLFAADYYLTSKDSKNKLGNTEQYQQIIDEAGDYFIEWVMEATGLSRPQVVQNGLEGGLFTATHAERFGFITGVADTANVYTQLLGEIGSMKKSTAAGTPTASADDNASNARWDACLAFVEKGVPLATCQTIAKSGMADEEATATLGTLVPTAGAGDTGTGAGGSGGSGGNTGDTGAVSAETVNSLMSAVQQLTNSHVETQKLIRTLAATDHERVEDPPGGTLDAPESDTEKGTTEKVEPKVQQERILHSVSELLNHT